MRFALKPTAALTALALLLGGCASPATETESDRFEDQVGVQLFMWGWDAIERECEFLGESGIDWVLTSPPQEHVAGAQWWTVYQPVSYQLESRLGTRDEFASMVQTCKENGVEIIADAVINHMTGRDSGVGFAGTEFSKYEYPGLYSRTDFHDCQLTVDGQIADYQNAEQVQTCELLGLSDLDQSRPQVQQRIVAYLQDLLSLGVAGFRIDAAKHMAAADLKAIKDQLPEETRFLHEVIKGASEPIQPSQYLDSGNVFEFSYARNLSSYISFEMPPADFATRTLELDPSSQAIAFVSNHDTERNGETLNYAQAADFSLATAFMLADDFGQPMLFSSYAFSDFDAGPTKPASCTEFDAAQSSDVQDGDWLCQHRQPAILNMIKFRDGVSGAPVAEEFYSEGVYGFARAGRGYFIANFYSDTQSEVSVKTTLPDGEYEDLISGSSHRITDGMLTLTLQPKTALALMVE